MYQNGLIERAGRRKDGGAPSWRRLVSVGCREQYEHLRCVQMPLAITVPDDREADEREDGDSDKCCGEQLLRACVERRMFARARPCIVYPPKLSAASVPEPPAVLVLYRMTPAVPRCGANCRDNCQNFRELDNLPPDRPREKIEYTRDTSLHRTSLTLELSEGSISHHGH